MARIAEDLLLTLLDNESAQPRLPRARLGRVLAAALILDLALGCRVRPAVPGEPVPPGTLVALAGPVPLDPAVRPALAVFEEAPRTPAAAIARLRKRAEDDVVDQLLRTGQIHQIQLSSNFLRRNTYAWPIHDRTRVDGIRAAIRTALLGGHRPDAPTAAVVALLDAAGALNDTLGPPFEGAHRAAQVTFGARAAGSNPAEVNLAATAAAVLPELN